MSCTRMLLLLLPMLTLSAPAAPAGDSHDRVERLAFNRAAVRLNLPLYWVADADADGSVDPDEVVTLLFYPTATRWMEGGRFTPDFERAYDRIASWAGEPPLPSGLSPEEATRRRLVIADLDQGRPTLVRTDMRDAPAADRTLTRHMLRAAGLIDVLYGRQVGAAALASRVPADDVASQSLFRRNWGPRCVAPRTESNPKCSAIPGAPKPAYDGYPTAMQSDPAFCTLVAKENAASGLTDPFTVVREREGELVALPVTEAYRDQTAALAAELRAAAADLVETEEAALKSYLLAAARGFERNVWLEADEAWAKMNVHNSRWYLRVAPDEVYQDPCQLKAGFHLTFARISKESLAWQEKLAPLQQEMEQALATVAGPPYAARRVSFHLPDFIEIVINAGEDRTPIGATIGQSLPNWGPVANEGRGRTVAMTNLYTDPDSEATRREGAESLFDTATLAHYPGDAEPNLLDTILHEAAHNLGPSHEYRVGGKTDSEIFGGPLASTMEELKAQTGAWWLTEFLRACGVIDEAFARQVWVDSLVWATRHVARGMYTGSDKTRPKPYSQLAAIQLGFLSDEGVLTFDPEDRAANGQDLGSFAVDLTRFAPAAEKLMRLVGGIKARGDKAAAEALVQKYVEGEAEQHGLIAERLQRLPKGSFVYSLEL